MESRDICACNHLFENHYSDTTRCCKVGCYCLGFSKVETVAVPTGGFQIKDSGERKQFASGMVRDTEEGKQDSSLCLNGPMFIRWAEHLTKGEVKYPPDPGSDLANWMKAEGQEELTRFRKSAVRHFIQWYKGETDEDHAAATFFNINGAEYVKEKTKSPTSDLTYTMGFSIDPNEAYSFYINGEEYMKKEEKK